MDIEEKVAKLVKEEFDKMKLSTKYSNRARLNNKCQRIVYNEWGISNNWLWNQIDRCVNELISEDMD